MACYIAFLTARHQANCGGCLSLSEKVVFCLFYFWCQLPVYKLLFAWSACRDALCTIFQCVQVSNSHARINAYGRNTKVGILSDSEQGNEAVAGNPEQTVTIFLSKCKSVFYIDQWKKMFCPCHLYVSSYCLWCLAGCVMMPEHKQAAMELSWCRVQVSLRLASWFGFSPLLG